MEKKPSDWYFPADLGCLLFSWVWIALITILAGGILPLISELRSGDVLGIFYTALGFACSGTLLLLLARLPLYRQRRFWTFGPRDLDQFHRRLYWLAYLVVITSIGFLAIVWFRLR